MWTVTPYRSVRAVRPAVFNGAHSALVNRFFNQSFDELFNHSSTSDEDEAIAARVDIRDTGASFEVKADLPGVNKEDVKVTIEDNRVSIEAATKIESEKKEGERVVYSERRTSSKFARSFTLPADVDSDAAQAKLENGVLTLTLPKKANVAAKQLTVN